MAPLPEMKIGGARVWYRLVVGFAPDQAFSEKCRSPTQTQARIRCAPTATAFCIYLSCEGAIGRRRSRPKRMQGQLDVVVVMFHSAGC